MLHLSNHLGQWLPIDSCVVFCCLSAQDMEKVQDELVRQKAALHAQLKVCCAYLTCQIDGFS